MKVVWEIFTLILGIGIILAIGKGFPQFGAVLRSLLFNPLGLVLLAGGILAIILFRMRAIRPREDSRR